jgi:predicted AAA+ superfamily ATPase
MLRSEDKGVLWEHFVLNEIQSRSQDADVRYWRDKHGHEVDFILPGRGGTPMAIECKWSAKSLEATSLQAFRRRYPRGENWLVAQDVDRAFSRTDGGVAVEHVGIHDFSERLGQLNTIPMALYRLRQSRTSAASAAMKSRFEKR